MHRRRNQLTVSAVAFVLGLLVIVQLRIQQVAPGLAGKSAQDLTVLVATLNAENDKLRTEIATLESDLNHLRTDQSNGQDSLDRIRLDLLRVRAWGGLEPVEGPGVQITVTGLI